MKRRYILLALLFLIIVAFVPFLNSKEETQATDAGTDQAPAAAEKISTQVIVGQVVNTEQRAEKGSPTVFTLKFFAADANRDSLLKLTCRQKPEMMHFYLVEMQTDGQRHRVTRLEKCNLREIVIIKNATTPDTTWWLYQGRIARAIIKPGKHR